MNRVRSIIRLIKPGRLLLALIPGLFLGMVFMRIDGPGRTAFKNVTYLPLKLP